MSQSKVQEVVDEIPENGEIRESPAQFEAILKESGVIWAQTYVLRNLGKLCSMHTNSAYYSAITARESLVDDSPNLPQAGLRLAVDTLRVGEQVFYSAQHHRPR